MPRRYRSFKSRRRSSGRPRLSYTPRRRNAYRNVYSLSRVPTTVVPTGPFPSRTFARLKYVDNLPQSGSAGVGIDYLFNLNSVFDPDRTGTGHQPYGHDQLSAIYNRYRVWSCRYKVSFRSKAGGSVQPVTVTVLPSNQTTSLVSVAASCGEWPGAKSCTTYWEDNQQYLQGRVYLPTLVGQSRTEYSGESENEASYGSSPSSICVLHCVMYPQDSGSSVLGYLNVELEYFVESFDQNQLAQS